MIIGDIETTEKVEYEDLLKNYYEKMEIIEEQDKEIERLNNIIEKIRNYVYKSIDKEWDDILCIIEDGLKGSESKMGVISYGYTCCKNYKNKV